MATIPKECIIFECHLGICVSVCACRCACCAHACACVGVHVAHVHLQRPEESTASLRAGVTNVCQACYMGVGPITSPYVGQQAFKNISPALLTMLW